MGSLSLRRGRGRCGFVAKLPVLPELGPGRPAPCEALCGLSWAACHVSGVTEILVSNIGLSFGAVLFCSVMFPAFSRELPTSIICRDWRRAHYFKLFPLREGLQTLI
jgi:hypothetical protein